MRLKRPNQLLPKWKARAKRKQFFSRLNNALDEQLMIRMRLQALIIKKEQPLQPLPEN